MKVLQLFPSLSVRYRNQDCPNKFIMPSLKSNQFTARYSRLDMTDIIDMDAKSKVAGLGIVTAAIFIAGETAGSGVLALPYAMINLNWWGVILLIIFGINCAFSGTRLGICYEIIEEESPDFGHEIRDPYPSIGEKAGATISPFMAKFLRHATFISVALVSYGSACVFLLLIGGFSYNIFSDVPYLNFSFCSWMYITTGLLIPICWLGTPKDFWPMAVAALGGTVTACILVMVQLGIDRNDGFVPTICFNNSTTSFTPQYPPPTLYGFCSAFGSLTFAYAGASVFPTIQADMADRSKFRYSAILAILVICLIYIPVASVGYYFMGDCLESNVVKSLKSGPIKIVIEVMLITHLITAYPIIMNPPNQYFEKVLGIPTHFNLKRIIFRTATVLICSFACISVPSFGSILDLVGSGPATCLNFIFPSMFYLLLMKDSSNRKLGMWDMIFCVYVLALGTLGGSFGTYNAFKEMFSTRFVSPCYIDSSVMP